MKTIKTKELTPLAEKIITLHGGSLAITSELNKGTVVSISFPFA